jgi:hypothetical protein
MPLVSRHLPRMAFALVLAAILLAASSVAASAQEGCTGQPRVDAQRPGCGLELPTGITELTWTRDAVPVGQALARESLALLSGSGDAWRYLDVWAEVAPGVVRGWTHGQPFPGMPLERFEPGRTYYLVAHRPLAWSFARPVPAVPGLDPAASIFDEARVVSLYGYPGIPIMGALGKYAPGAAADEAARVARTYEPLDPTKQVIPALHLIVSVAQRGPADGTYLSRMSAERVDEYVQATRERGQLLFLDIQIGWGDPLAEVRHYEAALREPHVHVALDPEFATRTKGVAPGRAIGTITGAQINQVQEYLAGLVTEHGLPRKVLVVHQFRDDMITNPAHIRPSEGVDLVICMDGFGNAFQKRWGYDRYAHASYAPFAGFKLFYDWDTPLLSPAEVLALSPGPPDYVIYQ